MSIISDERVEELLRCEKESNAEIERLTNIIRATEMERNAGDKVSNNLHAEIERLEAENSNLKRIISDWRIFEVSKVKDLITRAADALSGTTWQKRDELIRELREAAK